MNIKHKQTKDPLSLFFVDLEPQAKNKEIFNLKFLGNTKITIEAPHKNRNIVQCQRCQAYGHSVQSLTSVSNAVVNMIQKTVRNHDTIQRNVPCVVKITPRITRDALFTETW